jgi:hypothetical protein
VRCTGNRRHKLESGPGVTRISEATDIKEYIISKAWIQGGDVEKMEVGSGKSEK